MTEVSGAVSAIQRKAEKDSNEQKNLFWLLTTVFAVLTAPAAEAQQAAKVFRIGFLDATTAAGNAVLLEAFRQELSKLGWIEGKNITVEYRFAEAKA